LSSRGEGAAGTAGKESDPMKMDQSFMQRDGYDLIAAVISLALIGLWWMLRKR